jgi:hypothetical protein
VWARHQLQRVDVSLRRRTPPVFTHSHSHPLTRSHSHDLTSPTFTLLQLCVWARHQLRRVDFFADAAHHRHSHTLTHIALTLLHRTLPLQLCVWARHQLRRVDFFADATHDVKERCDSVANVLDVWANATDELISKDFAQRWVVGGGDGGCGVYMLCFFLFCVEL